MNITTDNIEEWCFRYLEKDLDATELTFFESELISNKVLQKEYALWKKTKITDLVIDIPTQLNTTLLRYNMQLIWLFVELSMIVGFSLLSICYRSTTAIGENSIPTNASVIIIDTINIVVTPKNKTQSAAFSELNPIRKKSIKPAKEEIILAVPSVQPYIDSSKQMSESTISKEYVLPTVISQPSNALPIDSIALPKDSTVKSAAPKKIKTTNRKRNTGSRLIPINNDL